MNSREALNGILELRLSQNLIFQRDMDLTLKGKFLCSLIKNNMFRYIMLLTVLIKSVFFLIALTLGFQGKLVLWWKRLTVKQCSRQGFKQRSPTFLIFLLPLCLNLLNVHIYPFLIYPYFRTVGFNNATCSLLAILGFTHKE